MDQTTVKRVIIFFQKSLYKNGFNSIDLALFGSAVSGKLNPTSDIDLIIVSDDFEGKDIFERARMTMKAEMETLHKFKIPMDVLNMTRQEYMDTQSNSIYQTKIVS